MSARPPLFFWVALALYVGATGYEAAQRWARPADLGWRPRPVHPSDRVGITADYPLLPLPAVREFQPYRLAGKKPLACKIQLNVEEPLASVRLHMVFPNPGKPGLLQVPLPRGAWVRNLSVDESQQPVVVLTSASLPGWKTGDAPAEPALELEIPGAGKVQKPVVVQLEYLLNLGNSPELRVPLPELSAPAQVEVAGKLALFNRNQGRFREQKLDVQGPTDLFFRRFNGGGALQGREWAAFSCPSGADLQEVQWVEPIPGERVVWIRRPDRGDTLGAPGLRQPLMVHKRSLIDLDSWAGWAQVSPAVYRGEHLPNASERQLIRENHVLCPFSRLQFPGLAAGGIRPGHP